jgi:hypothetical protein
MMIVSDGIGKDVEGIGRGLLQATIATVFWRIERIGCELDDRDSIPGMGNEVTFFFSTPRTDRLCKIM